MACPCAIAAGVEVQRLILEQREILRQWSPAFIAGGLAWLLLLFVGETPIARASGLALAILGVTASMRQMGFVASLAGGLTLTLCPAFWSQTGGGVSQPATIVIAVGAAGSAALLARLLSKRSELGLGLGIAVFALIFWSQIGTAQSLRLTGLVTVWLLYLLVDMLLLTNPRPGLKAAQAPKAWHTYGLLLLFIIGAINDPLVALFAPAIFLALFLSWAQLPAWYWLSFLLAALVGGALLWQAYQPPLVDIWGWRQAARWLELGELLLAQFSLFGILLSVIGLARLARWYPPLGTVSMIAYAAYALFGLLYLGNHRDILLLPLIIIQVLWMTYAVNTFGQWVNKSLRDESGLWIHVISALYFLVPAILLLNILQSQT